MVDKLDRAITLVILDIMNANQRWHSIEKRNKVTSLKFAFPLRKYIRERRNP